MCIIRSALRRIITCLLVLGSLPALRAATPPPEKLLPASTLAMVAIPNYPKALASMEASPSLMLLRDPAMKPIVDKFMAKWRSDLQSRLEKQFGLQFSNYTGLAEGQLTLALLAGPEDPKAGPARPFVFLMDSGSKSNQLKAQLEDLRKRWTEAGRKLKPESIRGVDFSTMIFGTAELEQALDKAFPRPKEDDEEPADKAGAGKKGGDAAAESGAALEWLVGQSGSLLIVGNSAKDLEKILALQAGAGGPVLEEDPHFAPWKPSMFDSANYYAWVNVRSVVEVVKKSLQEATAAQQRNDRATAPASVQLLDSLGFAAIRAMAYSSRSSADGGHSEFRLAVPESERAGVVKMLAFPAKDSSPPPFVPADALKFSRLRMDMARMFEVIEETLVKAFPASGSIIKMVMETTGKEKDPNFDLRKSLFGNLGDDYVSYARTPKDPDLESMNSPPSLEMFGARDAEQLASAVKMLTALFPTQGPRKDREVLGRKIHQLQMAGAEDSILFTPSEGYLVVTQDDAMLDEYLRSTEQKAKPLKDLPGLAADSEKVMGMGNGLFGYVNGRAMAKLRFEVLKKESGSIANLVASIPVASRLGWDEDARAFKDWLDLSLLPPFDQVAKYFHHSVYSGAFSAQGLEVKIFNPLPPELKKK